MCCFRYCSVSGSGACAACTASAPFRLVFQIDILLGVWDVLVLQRKQYAVAEGACRRGKALRMQPTRLLHSNQNVLMAPTLPFERGRAW